MAEATQSTSSHQKNILMLMEKLKELQMDSENSRSDLLIYSKVERKCLEIFFSIKK